MPAADPDPIALLLAGRYPDPETGELLAAESRAVVIEDSLDGQEADRVAALDLGHRVAVVSDLRTREALGRRVERALASRFAVQSIVIPDVPRADAETVARLGAALDPATDVVIAVGAGTLNDLCKMAAFERGLPQLVFATAPSMNGYTSLASSLVVGGVKRSFRTRTPVGVFVDLAVMARAPLRLIRAGLGDSLCRPTAQADWLLAHLLLDRPYREAPFALLAADEPALFAGSAALVSGDLEALRHLVRILVLSGFGMTICGGSFPASQGEHLLGHYLEMRWPAGVPAPLHGEQIGACTLAMARLQDRILAGSAPPMLRPSTVDRDDLVRRFGAAIGESCWAEYRHKRLDRDRAEAVSARLAAGWDALRARLAAVRLAAPALHRVLADAGAAITVEALGCPPSLFAEAMSHARELRDRYTFLDLAADARG